MLNGSLAESSLTFEIIHTDSTDARIEQTSAEETCRLKVRLENAFTRNAFLLGKSRFARKRKSGTRCKMFYGFGEIHIFDFLYKRECRTARLTTKAIEHALGRRYGKRGSFFAVERTPTNEIGTCALQRHISADKLLNIGSVDYFLYKIFGKPHKRSSLHVFFCQQFGVI